MDVIEGRTLACFAVAACGMAACSDAPSGASRLTASLESIGNEMRALHEPRRMVEYHDRTGKPYWLAFIPAHTSAQALMASGIPPERQCPASDDTTLAVGGSGPTDCVALAGLFTLDLRTIHKDAGATVQITLDLDLKGVDITALE
jgi:hypothetical protein